MSTEVPGEGRYAHVEREQRWLLREPPVGCVAPKTIVDRYLMGTTLRLRQVEDGAGVAVYKLGQKVRSRQESPEIVHLTNFYLRGEEHDVLAALPSFELRKTRWHLHEDDRTFVVDVFEGQTSGLVLAELELLPGEARLPLPDWASAEVTDDDRYSGGRLAARAADLAGIEELLAGK